MFHYFEEVNKGYLKMLNVMKGPGTSFQSPALNQKHVRNVCHTIH